MREARILPCYSEHGDTMTLIISSEDGSVMSNLNLAEVLRDFADYLEENKDDRPN